MKYLEDNYISIVAVVHNNENVIEKKINELLNILKENFKHYELILVDNKSADKSLEIIKKMPANFTYIELPVNHDTQSALAAGVNIAIGDYLVEIEDISIDMDYNLIMDMYRKCQEGNDFVFLTPQNTSFLSKLFYKVLNSSLTNFFKADIGSSLMTLSSRRGQNKTADIGRKLVNRNVSYVLSGLKYAYISCDINYRNTRSFGQNFQLMMQTLLYYTDIATRACQNISLFFLAVSVFFIFYSIYARFVGHPVEGWASTVIIISIGFAGVFLIMGMIIRYLDNILKNTSDSKPYIYRNIEKKQF